MREFLAHVILVLKSLKKKNAFMHSNFPSALPFVSHGQENSHSILEDIFEESPDSDLNNADDDYFQWNIGNNVHQLFNQSDHSDIIRHLTFTKEFAEIPGTRLK